MLTTPSTSNCSGHQHIIIHRHHLLFHRTSIYLQQMDVRTRRICIYIYISAGMLGSASKRNMQIGSHDTTLDAILYDIFCCTFGSGIYIENWGLHFAQIQIDPDGIVLNHRSVRTDSTNWFICKFGFLLGAHRISDIGKALVKSMCKTKYKLN